MAIKNFVHPNKVEQRVAEDSYKKMYEILKKRAEIRPRIIVNPNQEAIDLPLSAFDLLLRILKELSKGNPVSVLPADAELTTQAAAEYLGCSRPHIVKLLENKEIPFIKVGKHRRIKFEDLKEYKMNMKARQKNALIELMTEDEQDGLYDSQ